MIPMMRWLSIAAGIISGSIPLGLVNHYYLVIIFDGMLTSP